MKQKLLALLRQKFWGISLSFFFTLNSAVARYAHVGIRCIVIEHWDILLLILAEKKCTATCTYTLLLILSQKVKGTSTWLYVSQAQLTHVHFRHWQASWVVVTLFFEVKGDVTSATSMANVVSHSCVATQDYSKHSNCRDISIFYMDKFTSWCCIGCLWWGYTNSEEVLSLNCIIFFNLPTLHVVYESPRKRDQVEMA